MPLKKEESRRAEGSGYYQTYGSDASDVLGFLESDLTGVEPNKPYYNDGGLFKVTIIVEEV